MDQRCAHCGESLVDRARARFGYCSPKCRQAAYRWRREKQGSIIAMNNTTESTPDDQDEPERKRRHDELRRKLEADPRFKKGGKPGEAFIIPGAKPSRGMEWVF